MAVELTTFLQRLVPLTPAASEIAVGVMVCANRQLDHRLPEQTLTAPETLPDLLPRIVRGKIVSVAKVRKAVAEEVMSSTCKGIDGPSEGWRLMRESG